MPPNPSTKSGFFAEAPPEPGITELLQRAGAGNHGAEDELLEHLYAELRRIAHHELRRCPTGPTTQATALAHEAYSALMRGSSGAWPSRRHFLAAYTRALHNRVVDRIRRRAARGRQVQLSNRVPAEWDPERDDEVVALREHLTHLDRLQPRAAVVFRIHYLTGQTIPEIAQALALGHATIERDLRFARTWLHQRMKPV